MLNILKRSLIFCQKFQTLIKSNFADLNKKFLRYCVKFLFFNLNLNLNLSSSS